MVLLIVLGSITAYFLVGAISAHKTNARHWRRAIDDHKREWPILADRAEHYARRDAVSWWWMTLFLWPFVLPYVLASPLISASIESGNPIANEREQKALITRIAELERELGIR